MFGIAQLKLCLVRIHLRGLYVCSKTLGNLNTYKTANTGWDMHDFELYRHAQLE